ncbi:response regulator transcription factor [Bacilliculturomica massiliensis]|uniref:response regulator transcription factor n=1 Tax=Bacilliculturomica massiliensis TaxID=1917867 RepID=UPI0013EF4180|nr:response regulator transcription factor [Bacilliculturomica massiliensis]
MQRILMVEDEPNIRELVAYNLTANGFEALMAEDGLQGMEMAVSEKPDLILLDIMLPGKNGFDLCRELRQAGNRTPIIMLTAKNEEIDKVLGLEFGADDYISKPFGIRELIARIKAVLRRTGETAGAAAGSPAGGEDSVNGVGKAAVSGAQREPAKQDAAGQKPSASHGSRGPSSGGMGAENGAAGGEAQGIGRTAAAALPSGERLVNGDLVIDVGRHEVTVGGRKVELTLKEFDLLTTLARNRGLVFTRDQLLDKVWGFEYIGETRTVDVHVRYLRKKLGDPEKDGAYIQTVRGIGYKMP